MNARGTTLRDHVRRREQVGTRSTSHAARGTRESRELRDINVEYNTHASSRRLDVD